MPDKGIWMVSVNIKIGGGQETALSSKLWRKLFSTYNSVTRLVVKYEDKGILRYRVSQYLSPLHLSPEDLGEYTSMKRGKKIEEKDRVQETGNLMR